MKASEFLFCAAAAASLASCAYFESGSASAEIPDSGVLKLRFVNDFLPTKAPNAILDTNDFILTVTDSKGNSVYDGKYGACPEDMVVPAGTYSVFVRNIDFPEPLFDSPQWGDRQSVTVSVKNTSTVRLCCYQLNSGIRLKIDPSFLEVYPAGVLFLKSTAGRLMYSYTEKRTAYFPAGNVSLVLNNDSKDDVLFTRNLSPQQVLTVNIYVEGENEPNPGFLSIQVDTTRDWISENYTIGGSNAGDEPTSAYNVSQAKDHVGDCGVWVYGYIVGGDLSSSKCSFEPPFVSRTNLVLASKSSTRDKDMCLSVQLVKGDIRDEINLVDHEEYLGRQIFLKGDIVEAYYGIPGLQGITEYVLK